MRFIRLAALIVLMPVLVVWHGFSIWNEIWEAEKEI